MQIKIELYKYILTYNVKNNKNRIEDKVLADSCEALIGFIYLDKGFQITEKIILSLWSDNIKNSVITEIDAKTKLQEYSLKKFKKLPIYKLISNILVQDINLYSKLVLNYIIQNYILLKENLKKMQNKMQLFCV